MKKFTFLRTYKAGFVLGALSVIIIGGVSLFIINNLEDSSAVAGVSLQDQKVSEIIAEVKKTIQLPDEDPQVATVSDVEKLKSQAFFVDAENGDLVLIYNSTQKAVLYRPTTKKIINYSLVTLPTDAPQPSISPEISKPVVSATPKITPTPVTTGTRVVILNGTKEKGLAKKAQDLIQKAGIEVVSLSNTKGDYSTSSISNVSKTKKFSDPQLQQVVSGITKTKLKVISLPAAETVTNADIVIILGEDFAKQY